MKITYKFKDEYLDKLHDSVNLEDLIAWPSVVITFRDEVGNKLEFEPDICFWWLDTIIGALENDQFDQFNDITGYAYKLKLIDGKLDISNQDKLIFTANVKKEEFLKLLIETVKKMQHEVENINPKVRKEKSWQSYYFVSNYND